MLVREIILENFMSYEYARVPFRSGVNVICGPNGAGKSSILLGLSIALGQSYTERSRKLSNLIRWGKDQARVTIVLDNSVRKGKRPERRFNKDQIFLTRVLRKDGKYWFELDNRAATKGEVERLLSKFNVDPENLLIIMHQNMTEQFTIISPQEKLRTVEAAVGLESYRKNVLKAKKKLSRILSQEESVDKLLESAEQTLNYWREQYDKYQQKKQLEIKRRFLEREFTWAEVAKRESIIKKIETQLRAEESELKKIIDNLKIVKNKLDELQIKLNRIKLRWQELFQERILIEREIAKNETSLTLKSQTIEDINQIFNNYQEKINECFVMFEQLEISPILKNDSVNLGKFNEIKKAYKNLESMWTRQFRQKSEGLKEIIQAHNENVEKTSKHLQETQLNTTQITEEIDTLTDGMIDSKIESALLNYRGEEVEIQIKKIQRELTAKKREFVESAKEAEKVGSRIASTRNSPQILDEMRLTDGYLASLGNVSEDIERMYESYSKLYLELKEKAQRVAENREKTLEEVKARMDAWQNVMQQLLDDVDLQYQGILSQAQGVGRVRLADKHDIESAGLEVLVGFKGAEPVPLDAYTQSGGERSMATVSFLLALQQHIQSPFRAVDEYDVHMDPRNRETITNLLIKSVEGLNQQYFIITPSRITLTDKQIHLITVQNVESTSRVQEAS